MKRLSRTSMMVFVSIVLAAPFSCQRNISAGNPISKEELERYCEMRLRVLPDFADYTSCLMNMAYLPPLDELHPEIRNMIECALAAAEQGDEEAFYACYNFGLPRESCSELDTNWCDGDELATCDSDGEVSYWPCAAFGDQCMYNEQRGEYTCALPCPEGRAEGESWCDGQWQNECSGGLLSRVSCSNLGQVCIEEEFGAACVPDGNGTQVTCGEIAAN